MGLKERALGSVGRAVSARTQGEQPSRTRALVAAALAGVASAVITYRVLRQPAGAEARQSAAEPPPS